MDFLVYKTMLCRCVRQRAGCSLHDDTHTAAFDTAGGREGNYRDKSREKRLQNVKEFVSSYEGVTCLLSTHLHETMCTIRITANLCWSVFRLRAACSFAFAPYTECIAALKCEPTRCSLLCSLCKCFLASAPVPRSSVCIF